MEEIAAVYARSLFEVAQEQNKLDAVRDQLHAGWAAMFSGVPRDDVTKTLDTELRTLRRALHESEELRQWENGRP